MARTDGIDDRFEALLKERLRERNREGRDNCPEVAAIAAFCERLLPRTECDAIEQHLAGCALCRAELTAIARAAHELEEARAAPPRLTRWWSSAPLGLAVAGSIAVVVAIGLGRDYYHQEAPSPAQLAMRQSSRNSDAILDKAARPAAKAVAPSAALEANAPAANAIREPEPAQERPERMEERRKIRAAVPPAAAGAAGGLGNRQAPAPLAEFAKSEQGAGATAPAGGSIAAPAAPTRMAGSPQAPSSADMGVQQLGPQAIPGGKSASEAPASSAAGAPTFARLWPHSTISSPDGAVRWEFGRGGVIERFVPTGMTTVQVPGVTVDLLAGSAPSSSVCWIVGRGGTVLRTIDGSHWEKINSPAATDLIAVSAQGPDAAIVTAQDSRRYATSDGGQTWQAQ